jgi:hypothetical protein
MSCRYKAITNSISPQCAEIKMNTIMKTGILNLTVFVLIISTSACITFADKAKQESNDVLHKTSKEVQQVIDELGLVYVEEGAQHIITYDEVNAAQQAWCDALVRIGSLKEEGGDYRAYAEQVLSEAYNYDNGKVFFKPTLAFGSQTFRNDKKGALAYFVGGDSDYPDDSGFALKPWVKARFDNAGEKNEGIQIYGSVAITMGNVWVTGKDGTEVMVDKTWVYKKGKDGKLRIIVHKSSLPYTPASK